MRIATCAASPTAHLSPSCSPTLDPDSTPNNQCHHFPVTKAEMKSNTSSRTTSARARSTNRPGKRILLVDPMDIPMRLRMIETLLVETTERRLARLAGIEPEFHYKAGESWAKPPGEA